MGRNKEYKREQLLASAIKIFRKNGFHATSTDFLADEFGINKKSLYAEFGSKLNLFTNTLEYYEQTFLSEMLKPIEEKDASTEGIKTLFNRMVEFGQKDLCGLGCLLCNTSAQRGSLDACIGPLIDNYYERIQSGFQYALKNFTKSKKSESRINIQIVSNFLTTTLIGMATSIRAEAPIQQLRGTCKFIESYIDSLST